MSEPVAWLVEAREGETLHDREGDSCDALVFTFEDEARRCAESDEEGVEDRVIIPLIRADALAEVPAAVSTKMALTAKPQPTEEQFTDWLMELARRCKVEVVTFGDGTRGLLNIAPRAVAMIDQMHIAVASILRGEGLPEFLPESPPKTKPTGRKRKK